MAEQTPKPPAAPQPPTIENLTFQGVQTKDLPEHLRARHNKLAKLQSVVQKQRGLETATGAAKKTPADFPDNREDLARLAQIKAELPSVEVRQQFRKQLRTPRGLLQGGFGQTSLDDKEGRIDRILKKRNRTGMSAEQREELVQQLIKDAADKVEYDPDNFLFNPDERAIDYDAAEVLQIWSMDNLAKKFESPKDLYENFGNEYRRQQELNKEAGELLRKTAQERPPDYVLKAQINGKEAIAVPRFGDVVDKEFAAAAANDPLLHLMYNNDIDPKILSMYAKGLRLEQSDEAIREAMGNDTDAEFIRQNAFHADKPGRAVDFYLPVDQTPDGTLQIPYEKIQKSIENYMYQIALKSRGVRPGELPEDEVEQLRDSVRERVKVLLTPMKQTENRVLHKDPEGVLRDFQEGDGWRAGVLRALETTNSILTLGQKEKILNNLPDRIAKAYVAMTLPRRAAGVVLEEGQETGFAREGELFVPAFGDSAPTNALDFIIRLISFDEPWTRAFAMSVDDEARSDNEADTGRPGRIISGMAKHVGTEEHVAYLTEDSMAGGRYINEFGDAFINPLLGEFGEENPTPGRVLGGITALGTMIFSPDAFTAIAGGVYAGTKASTAFRRAAGLTDQPTVGKMADGGEALRDLAIQRGLMKIEPDADGKDAIVILGATEAEKFENLGKIEELMNKGNETLEGVQTDKTGGIRTLQLLAGMDTALDHGIVVPFRIAGASSPKAAMAAYTQYGLQGEKLTQRIDKLEKVLEQATKREDLLAKANTETEILKLKTEQMEIALAQEKLVAGSLQQLAESEDVMKAISDARESTPVGKKYNQMHRNLAVVYDSFRALRGDATLDSVIEAHGLGKNVKLASKKSNPALRLRQQRALIARGLADAIEGVPLKQLSESRKLLPQMKLVGQNIGKIVDTMDDINDRAKSVDKALKGLIDVEDLAESKAVKGTASKSDLLTALNNRYDRMLVGARKVKEAAIAEGKRIQDIADEKVALSKLTETERQARAVSGYEEYLTRFNDVLSSARTISRMDENLFNEAVKATDGRVRAAFKDDIIEGGVEATEKLTDKLQEFIKAEDAASADVVDAIYDTSTLIKFFRDPIGEVQLGVRDFRGKDFSIQAIAQNPRAFAIWTGVEVQKLMEKFPIFNTNVRFVESIVSRKLDDAAKITNRRTNDIMDSLDLIAANVTDAAEAGRLIRKVLTTTDGVIEITSKARLPFTRGATIALTGIVGRSESLIATFITNTKSLRKAHVKAGSDEMVNNRGLDAAIKAFIPDESLTDRGNFLAPGGTYSKIRNKVYEDIAKMPDDMPGDKQLDELINIIRRAISDKNYGNTPIKAKKDDSIVYARSVNELHKAVVFGAMQADLTARIFEIVGPRFNSRMARAMNYIMGLGQDSADNFTLRDFEANDYVIMRSDAELIAEVGGLAAKQPGRRPEADQGASSQIGHGINASLLEPGVNDGYAYTRKGERFLEEMQGDIDATIAYQPSPLTDMSQIRRRNLDTEEMETLTVDLVDHLGNPVTPGSSVISEQDLVRWLADNAMSDTHRQLARLLEDTASADVPVVFYKKGEEALENIDAPFNMTTHGFPIDQLTPGLVLHNVIRRVAFNVAPETPAGRKYFKSLAKQVSPYVNPKTGRWTNRGKTLIKGLGITDAHSGQLGQRLSLIFKAKSPNAVADIMTDPEIREFLNIFKVDADTAATKLDTDFFLSAFRNATAQDKTAFTELLNLVASQRAVRSGYRMKPGGTSAFRAATPDAKVTVKRKGKGRPDKVEDAGAPRKVAKEFYRLPELEKDALAAMGKSAKQIVKVDGDRVLIKEAGNEPYWVNRSEIVHRDIGFSMLDAVDGFHAFGMAALTSLGRKKADEAMRDLRAMYQKMVIAGVDEAGNVRMMPASFLATMTDRFSIIEKELDEALSVAAASSAVMGPFASKYLAFLRFWKTHILTGLIVPRPAYFMNQFFGDYSQMVLTQGIGRATQISAVGALAYVPVYGNALQEAFIKMASRAPTGANHLPPATGSVFNLAIDKMLRGSDELVPGLKPPKTYAEFMDEALGAGIGEGIRERDFATSIRDSLLRAQKVNPTVFDRLADAGQPLTYMQKVMEYKIREVSRRQRLLFYADMRINKGLDVPQATQELKNTLYDWSHSVGRTEMDMLGQYVLFYTLSKNAMAQVFRMFFEASDVGLKEYMKRYARGGTQLQRFEIMSRLMTQYPTPAYPFEDLQPEEVRAKAGELNIPDYLEEYPLLSLHTLSPEAMKIMGEGGFVRSHYARTLPKATSVEYALNGFQIAGALTALVVAAGNALDPEGRVIPYSANSEMAFNQLADSVIDQYLVPIYGDISRDFLEEMVGLDDVPASQYGRRVKKGDMMMYELLANAGALSPVTLTDDPKEPGTKRITFSGLGPFTDPILSIPTAEYHRFRMMLGLAFPGMAPSEIKALAAEGGDAQIRLNALADILNVGRAMFYNGDKEIYYRLDEVRDRLNELNKQLEREALSD